MKLPIQVMPSYNLTIPSSQKKIRYRPFTIKEEKALLIAQQSEDNTTMFDTLKQVIAACIKEDVDADQLAMFDIEYIFTQIRARSVEEIVNLKFRCDKCETICSTSINLTEVEVKTNPKHNKKIPLYNSVGIMMRYPGIDALKIIESLRENSYDINQIFELITKYCIDYIYDDTQTYLSKDLSAEQLEEFINSLTSKQFDQIAEFIKTMPVLRHDVTYTCPSCGHVHNKYMEGFNNFF